jgi:hypothetical protein
VRLKGSRYSVRLARLCAERLESAWHARAEEEGSTDIHRALEWWDDEQGAWRLAHDLAQHHRQWQTRLDVIHEMQAFAERNGLPPFRVVHPRYVEQPIQGDRDTVERAARHETHFSDLRMSILANALSVVDEGALPGADAWERHLRALDAAGERLPAETRKRLADNRAAVWGSVRHAFCDAPMADDDARERFETVFTTAVAALAALPPVAPSPPPPVHANGTPQAPGGLRTMLHRSPWPRRVWAGAEQGLELPGRPRQTSAGLSTRGASQSASTSIGAAK